MTVEVARRALAGNDREQRIGAAEALAAMADPAAHAVLDAHWTDEDEALAAIAVRAAVFRDLSTVWQRFRAPVQAVLDRRASTPADEAVVRRLLDACYGSSPRRAFDPDPFLVEPRLVDLAARLRHHERFAMIARLVLGAVPHAHAIAAIERYPLDPILPRAALPERRDYLARYLAGERGVWNELVEQALAVVQYPELREEAQAVAHELMKRVRHNADAVRATLREAGALLADHEVPPTDEELSRARELLGPLPTAIEAFWREVGSIALRPEGALEIEGIELRHTIDPLEVRGARQLARQLAAYEQRIAASHREIVGPLPLALPYVIELPPPEPADALDPRVHYARHRLRFVEYLRHCFRWGGFCVLEIAHRPVDHIPTEDRVAFGRVQGAWGDAADRVVARLRTNLVDF
jgi:hypothetical protein